MNIFCSRTPKISTRKAKAAPDESGTALRLELGCPGSLERLPEGSPIGRRRTQFPRSPWFAGGGGGGAAGGGQVPGAVTTAPDSHVTVAAGGGGAGGAT